MAKIQTSESTPQKNCTIILPFDQVKYMSSIHDPMQFRNELEAFINRYPELFPNKIKAGYRLKESRLRSILMLCEQVKIGENGVLAEYL